MKKIALAGMAALASLAAASGASAATSVISNYSEGSPFDLFNGAIVDSSTAILGGFSAQDAFGQVTPNNAYPESLQGGHVIFANAGFNSIAFHTASPVSFNTFRIFASGDGVGNSFRGFTSVSLFATDGGVDVLLGTASYDPAAGPVRITGTFGGITATNFRFDSTSSNGGPRVLEIEAVPEPATWGMMILGFGMMGLGLRARRKASVRVTYA